MTWKTLYVYPNPHALSIAFSDNVGPSNWLTLEGQTTTIEAPYPLVTKTHTMPTLGASHISFVVVVVVVVPVDKKSFSLSETYCYQ